MEREDAVRLTGADRRYLRGLANPRKAVVQVGENGLTDAVIRAVDAALRDHELVKVRLHGDREERRGSAEALAAQTHCGLAGLIGGVAILFRPADDPAARQIRLPSAAV